MATIIQTLGHSIKRIPSVHHEGHLFIGIPLGLSFAVLPFCTALAIVFLSIALFCAYFFRDPQRKSPGNPHLLIAPADGIITSIEGSRAPIPGDPESYIRVSIFLSIFDVHINRSPCDGQIQRIRYKKGEFLNALHPNSAAQNEQNVIEIESLFGRVYVVQIAGLMARRIRCFVEHENLINQGQRIGLIKFSSRTDIYLPCNFRLLVCEGQTMIGGETVIGLLPTITEQSVHLSEGGSCSS